MCAYDHTLEGRLAEIQKPTFEMETKHDLTGFPELQLLDTLEYPSGWLSTAPRVVTTTRQVVYPDCLGEGHATIIKDDLGARIRTKSNARNARLLDPRIRRKKECTVKLPNHFSDYDICFALDIPTTTRLNRSPWFNKQRFAQDIAVPVWINGERVWTAYELAFDRCSILPNQLKAPEKDLLQFEAEFTGTSRTCAPSLVNRLIQPFLLDVSEHVIEQLAGYGIYSVGATSKRSWMEDIMEKNDLF